MSAYRKGHNTTTVLLAMRDDILQAMQRGEVTMAVLGGVYMRKLAPARLSYRHDFLISYRVYMTGLFHI